MTIEHNDWNFFRHESKEDTDQGASIQEAAHEGSATPEDGQHPSWRSTGRSAASQAHVTDVVSLSRLRSVVLEELNLVAGGDEFRMVIGGGRFDGLAGKHDRD